MGKMNKITVIINLIMVALSHGHSLKPLSSAVAKIQPTSTTSVSGEIKFKNFGSSVLVTGKITGLSAGFHGFHVHEFGTIASDCTDSASHFNPHKVNHGGQFNKERHVGDLGNIYSNGKVAYITKIDNVISFNPKDVNYIGNRTLVVHADVDDRGKGDASDSHTTGHAGARLGCGVIELV